MELFAPLAEVCSESDLSRKRFTYGNSEELTRRPWHLVQLGAGIQRKLAHHGKRELGPLGKTDGLLKIVRVFSKGKTETAKKPAGFYAHFAAQARVSAASARG